MNFTFKMVHFRALSVNYNCSEKNIELATGAMAGFNKILNVKTAEILRTRVFSVLLYATETWIIKKTDQDRLML